MVGENRMGRMAENRRLLGMAVPTVASMLVQALYNIVDSIFVGQIGESALTAVSMTFPVQTLIAAFAVGNGVGMTQLLSKKLGEKDYDVASRAGDQGILLSLITCAAFVFERMLIAAGKTVYPMISQIAGAALNFPSSPTIWGYGKNGG
jgi:Na+-driven multidrug efflux pump